MSLSFLYTFKRRQLVLILVGIILSLSGGVQAKDITLQHLYTIGQHDDGLRFMTPTSVCFDSQKKEVLVSDAGAGMVITFGQNGNSIGYFYHRRKGQCERSQPIGLAVDSHGIIYVTDQLTPAISTYDYLGNQLGVLQMPSIKDQAALPGKMAFDKDGNLYVTVRNSGCIVVFDSQGHFKDTINVPDAQSCSDVAVGDDGTIYALSPKGTVVYCLDPHGQLLRKFGSHTMGPDGFSWPSGIDIDSSGRLWIVDSIRQVIKVFQPDGTFLQSFGGLGTDKGDFFFPVDLYIDKSSNTLYVIEKNGQRLQAFRINQ